LVFFKPQSVYETAQTLLMNFSGLRKKFLIFVGVAGAITLVLIYIDFAVPTLREQVTGFFGTSDRQSALNLFDNLVSIFKIILWMFLVIAVVRFLNSVIFNNFLHSSQYEISNLVRNVFSIIIFVAAFFIILQSQYSSAYEKLTPIFTGSTILAVVVGLALQDTLGNLFSGLAIQADQPFQIGDVITVADKGTGVVENISWRGVKIRTFQNKLLVISNSVLGKESLEVAPRDNLNARLLGFGTLYANSPAHTIKIVREVVRQVENVSHKLRPIVRIKNFGDSGIDWEVKYWLDDYAKYNETDALVRQRIWYAFQREQIDFYFPTRTLFIENKPHEDFFVENTNEIFERLSNNSIFAPLSDEETRKLAAESDVQVFAPGEAIVLQGQDGNSMFVIHRGAVRVQITEDGKTKVLDTLRENGFFGEMGLLTGAPRTATVVAEEETEVLEISNLSLKPILEANPELVSSFSSLVEERRALIKQLEAKPETKQAVDKTSVFDSIKKFFGLSD